MQKGYPQPCELCAAAQTLHWIPEAGEEAEKCVQIPFWRFFARRHRISEMWSDVERMPEGGTARLQGFVERWVTVGARRVVAGDNSRDTSVSLYCNILLMPHHPTKLITSQISETITLQQYLQMSSSVMFSYINRSIDQPEIDQLIETADWSG